MPMLFVVCINDTLAEGETAGVTLTTHRCDVRSHDSGHPEENLREIPLEGTKIHLAIIECHLNSR